MANANSMKQSDSGTATYFGIEAGELAARSSLHTAEEIAQQPRTWREAQRNVDARRQEIGNWLMPVLAMPRVQVLFCGAGTSAFIGDTLAAWFQKAFKLKNPIDFRAVSTTDLVADPAQYLSDDRPTVLVSFARSGDSPESVATVALGDQLLSQCFHLIFTCNPEGALATYAADRRNALCLLMPSGTNDRGFAMTSSYSAMLVSCVTVFTPSKRQLDRCAGLVDKTVKEGYHGIAAVAARNFDRLVVLGSGALVGTAREAALKCLELAAGKLTVMNDTPLGFRHGPKIVVSENTVVVQMLSTDPYVRRYDEDLLAELRNDDQAAELVELSPEGLYPGEAIALDDIWLSLVYVVHCQILAFLNSWFSGVSVDSPCPSGEVNRVVQGVTIHPYPGLDG